MKVLLLRPGSTFSVSGEAMFYQVLGVLMAILLIYSSLRAWQTGELKMRRRGRLRHSEYPFLFHSMLAIRLILGVLLLLWMSGLIQLA